MINSINSKVISFFSLCLMIAAIGITTSCEDEVVDRIVELPGDTVKVLAFNHIVSFRVAEFSADTVLEAVSKEDSLIIYWPSYRQKPDTIAPDITIAEGAAIEPASGEGVPFNTGTRYTVTAENKSARQYILKVVIYQPEPVYRDDLVRRVDRLDGESRPINIGGDHFIPDTEQTSMYLISWERPGEETKLRTIEVTLTRFRAEVPASLPNGYYRTRMVSGARTVSKQDSVWVKLPAPFIDWRGSDLRVYSQGETFEVQGGNFFDIERLEVFVGLDANSVPIFVPIEIISSTPTSMSLKLSEDFPVGTYSRASTNIYSPWANRDGVTVESISLKVE